MAIQPIRGKLLWPCIAGCLCWLAWDIFPSTRGVASPPNASETSPPAFTVDAAVRWGLQHNPELAALRLQHGIAAADIVIARTYPFNPVFENRIQQASGPESAGITNVVPLENLLLWEIEIRGQGDYRHQRASAGLTRTDWEIASQEQLLAIRIIRAFRTLLYQQEKLRLLEETVRLNQQLVNDVQTLLRGGQVRAAELILAQTEVEDARAALGPGRTTVTTARYELRRALGLVDEVFEIDGSLAPAVPDLDGQALTQVGLERRADLHAHAAAVTEAEAKLRLAVADRYGNPTIGPAFSYDPSRVSMIGAQINLPLPVVNTHRGDILQRQAELGRANLELRQTEILVRQDVQAALARLEIARNRVEAYQTEFLPNLQKSLDDIERLFHAGEPGVDVLRVIDVRRKLLRARDASIDARWELGQAQADVLAAIGDLGVSGPPCAPPQIVETLPPLKP